MNRLDQYMDWFELIFLSNIKAVHLKSYHHR